MGKIFVLMGKSATGKDTIFKALQQDPELSLKTVVSYTTRPIREGEENGREYYFVTNERWEEMKRQNLIIESRTYHTVHGDWHYFTANDGQIVPDASDYLLISTLEGFRGLCRFFGKETVVPLYIEVEDGIRLQRALDREKQQKKPKYEEMCRRFLADAADFSEEKRKEAGIDAFFRNDDLNVCRQEIVKAMKGFCTPAGAK